MENTRPVARGEVGGGGAEDGDGGAPVVASPRTAERLSRDTVPHGRLINGDK